MLTVTRLARRCGLGRSTVLYYESIGLLRAAGRSPGNYRLYSASDVERLRQIRAYRNMGLSLADIRSVMSAAGSNAASVLKRRLLELDAEIDTLRGHQRSILRLLEHGGLRRNKMMTKDKWVAVMRRSGFTDDQMHAWHVEFERSAPDEHQEFLEFLQIPADEIAKIRKHARDRGRA
jgi:DNA-binding transcriptional MerR regulator